MTVDLFICDLHSSSSSRYSAGPIREISHCNTLTRAVKNVYANFDFSTFFVFELGARMGQTDGRTGKTLIGAYRTAA